MTLFFGLPEGSFIDVDAGDSLSYSATLVDGSALPSWLSFDATTQIFSGTPSESEIGTLSIQVTATDLLGLTVSDEFDVTVNIAEPAPIYDEIIIGNGSRETIVGSSGNDYLDGQGGSDIISGESGNDVIIGGTGSDDLSGGDGNDHLYGGKGKDKLSGDAGDDVYHFNAGDEFDTIDNGSSASTDIDELIFGEGIDINTIWFDQYKSHLDIYLLGSKDKIRISDWYNTENNKIDSISSGADSLDGAGIEQLVNAMSAFGTPKGGDISLTNDEKNQIDTIIAAAWQ